MCFENFVHLLIFTSVYKVYLLYMGLAAFHVSTATICHKSVPELKFPFFFTSTVFDSTFNCFPKLNYQTTHVLYGEKNIALNIPAHNCSYTFRY